MIINRNKGILIRTLGGDSCLLFFSTQFTAKEREANSFGLPPRFSVLFYFETALKNPIISICSKHADVKSAPLLFLDES
jgi:hypothetical protein